MCGLITKRHAIFYCYTIICGFGFKTWIRVLTAKQGTTFIEIVAKL